MTLVIYPGTFDPITYGHINIIKRSLYLFDKVVVAIGTKKNKNTLFSKRERFNIAKKVLSVYKNVEVVRFDGLLVDFYSIIKANAVVRGIRYTIDFEYEYRMGIINRTFNKKIETILFVTDKRYSMLSSSLIREVSQINISHIVKFVSPIVVNALLHKFSILSYIS
jgi:pantetheine-phosphate adenylyltransferase